MALVEHLRELRRRVILAVSGILVGGVLGWILYEPIALDLGALHWRFAGVFPVLQGPILSLAEERPELVTINFGGIGTAFDMRLRIALFTGIFISSPWWIYQMLAFVTPGLTRKEKQYTFGFLGAAVPLFFTGAVLAWTVLPRALEVLIGEFTPDNSTNLLDAAVYLKFVMQIVLAFGIVFLLPLVMVALTFMGVVKGRTWLKGWRWAIVGIFTFCAFATPNPEPTAMIFMALPIIVLYFIAVWICHLRDNQVAKRRAREDAELASGSTTDVESSDSVTSSEA